MRTALFSFFLVAFGSVVGAAQTEHRLSVAIPPAPHTITATDSGHRVHIDNFGALREPGVPQLPVRIFPIAIPPGAEVVRVTCTAADPVKLPERCVVAPAPIWEPIGGHNDQARAEEQRRYDANRAAIYNTDEPYPDSPVEFVRSAGYRGCNLVDVRILPLAYRPLSRQLLRYEQITVHIDYRLPEQQRLPIAETSPAIARAAQDLILNHEQASAWQAGQPSAVNEQYEYVVITPQNLVDGVAPLVDWEQQKGRSVRVVTTQWVAANYTGVDLAEQIRNFLRDKYSVGEWGIEYVLLVGDNRDVPMRLVWQDLGYGMPRTDSYYAELSRPDRKSWDLDGDRRYAEDEDEIDFYNEIIVGRIPWSDPATVQHICEKSIAFEQNDEPEYKKNILLLGGFFWPDTDCAILKETIAALGHLSDWTSIRMYEQGHSRFPMDYDLVRANVVPVWSGNKYAVVTWCGHGSRTSAHRYYDGAPAFITTADCPVLNDSYPSIVFADSCRTSDPLVESLGRQMVRRGAVGYVGATEVAGGRRGWEKPADGSSQTLNYLFNSHVTSGLYTQGEALNTALRQTYLQSAWRWPKYEMLEWGALYGNPDLGIGPLPAVHIHFPQGRPDHIEPGAGTAISVHIDPILDTLVPGSQTLHYRLDDGAFQTVPLTPLGNKHYEAVLPAAVCTHTPEYYVSARGATCGLVTQPADAPNEVFTATVGTFTTIFHDDFQRRKGWMVENLGATDGDWERGVPVDDPNWFYDPFADADGSGKCFLTANRFGNSDVDRGGVRLTSPTLDMTAENITLRYSFYLYAEDQAESDYLLVEVSSNGQTGPWQELVRHIRNNGLSWRTDSFTGAELQALGIELTDRMHVRYTAFDGGGEHVVEAGVDAFEVLSFGCSDALPGDLDLDGDVDLDDFSLFAGCMGGPQAGTPPPACDPDIFTRGDLDEDEDMDLEDFAAFQDAFNPE